MNSIPQENQQSLGIRYPSENLNLGLYANDVNVLAH